MKSNNILKSSDKVLCAGTLANTSFKKRVEVASTAGFRGISIFAEDYKRALEEEKLSITDMRSLLADHQLCIAELDPLLDWIDPNSNDAHRCASQSETFFYQMADTIGARSLNVATAFIGDSPIEKIAECFAAVADRANERGLLVHLEFLPWTSIDTLTQAREVIALANRNNAGIMLDTWHHFRSKESNDVIELMADKVFAIQINDAPAESTMDLITETMQHRLLPGEGDIPLKDIISKLRLGGCNAPIGIEVFSEQLTKKPAEDIAFTASTAIDKVCLP